MADVSGCCTAQRVDGTFCDSASVPDTPFPICAKHLRQVYEFARDLVGEWDQPRALGFLIEHEERQQQAHREAVLDANSEAAKRRDLRVYYLVLDGLVKIGCTMDLSKRLLAYPPHARLLASERGYFDLEHQRHMQFAHLNAARREWFRAEPELLDFIASLPAV